MTLRVFTRVAALSVAAAVLVALTGGSPRAADPEIARLRAHFAAVERELLARDVSLLPASQRSARTRHIERLRVYAAAGVFPRNTDFAGRAVPYFIDRSGTRCAMAQLIEQAGSASYVHRVAERANNAFVAEIARDTALRDGLLAWLEVNGLTVDEAARIQPAYCGEDDCCPGFGEGPCPLPEPGAPAAPEATRAYKIGTGTAVLSGLMAIAVNASLLRPGISRRASGWLGISAGFLGVGLGLAHIDDDGDFTTLAPLNLVAGAAALWSGVRALQSAGSPRAATREPRLRAVPWAVPGGSAGVQLRVTF